MAVNKSTVEMERVAMEDDWDQKDRGSGADVQQKSAKATGIKKKRGEETAHTEVSATMERLGLKLWIAASVEE
jgi:hypothetical protein